MIIIKGAEKLTSYESDIRNIKGFIIALRTLWEGNTVVHRVVEVEVEEE